MGKEIMPKSMDQIVLREASSLEKLYSPVVSERVTKDLLYHYEGNDRGTMLFGGSSFLGAAVIPALSTYPFIYGPWTELAGVALGVAVLSPAITVPSIVKIIKRRQYKKYGALFKSVIDKNFEIFTQWAKQRYNITLDTASLSAEHLKNIKKYVSGAENFASIWVKDTLGREYRICKNEFQQFYLREEKNTEAETVVVFNQIIENHSSDKVQTELSEFFAGETLSLWDALQSRLTTVENFGLSIENAHVIQRVQNDCAELSSNVYKLSKLDIEPNFEELEKALVGLNQEVQNVINDEATQVKKEITKTTDWIAVRNLQINKDLTADELAVLPTLLLRNEGQ